MKLWEKQCVFAQNVSALIHEISRANMACTLGEVYRTAEQASIYALQGKGIKNSLHCRKLAIDIQLFTKEGDYLATPKDYEPFGIIWKNLHPLNEWGGDWKTLVDACHFQMKDE